MNVTLTFCQMSPRVLNQPVLSYVNANIEKERVNGPNRGNVPNSSVRRPSPHILLLIRMLSVIE